MPKVTNTRKQRAAELLKRLQNGPAFPSIEHIVRFEHSNPQHCYRRWAESWILDEVKALIPELSKEGGR